MALYKSDCKSNDCELPSDQATPQTLAREVWPVNLPQIVKLSPKLLCYKIVHQWLIYSECGSQRVAH